VKTGCNWAESSKEGYGLKSADLPTTTTTTMMMMMIMMNNVGRSLKIFLNGLNVSL
jgi:hypothetical protein